MRDVAVVGFAQRQMKEFDGSPTCVELLVPLFAECYEQTGFTRRDIGFWCSGSSDYLAGRSFSFVSAVDAIGALPPVNESHVEMDAAWALYEAWVKIQTGEVDTALVYGFGKSSAGRPAPHPGAPARPVHDDAAVARHRVAGRAPGARRDRRRACGTRRAMAEVANRSLTDAEKNEYAVRKGGSSVDELLARPMYADPLRKHDCAPVTDGAAAIVLAADDRARDAADRPAWISGIAHYVDPLHLGARDLTRSASAARRRRGGRRVRRRGGRAARAVQPPGADPAPRPRAGRRTSGSTRRAGALTSNPMFTGGLIRIGEAARRVWDGSADRRAGPRDQRAGLQQNLVCVMEGAN